jgi:nucleotide-binding universal stress UspA family protein
MKAIIATDGSSRSIAAAQAAEQLLHPDIEFLLVSIVPEPEDPIEMSGGFEGPLIDADQAAEITEATEEAGREAILRTARRIHEPMTARLVEDDDAGKALCRLAAEQAADVVVIGASDKSVVQRFLEGSVMRYVVKHSPCPVLVVRHD